MLRSDILPQRDPIHYIPRLEITKRDDELIVRMNTKSEAGGRHGGE
jgi:hypothetical protein